VVRRGRQRTAALARCSGESEHTHVAMQAEWKRLQGRDREALALYVRASDAAAKHGYRHHAALLHERRAALLVALARANEASAARSRAAAYYEEWNAGVKVEQLRRSTEPVR
jgi:hypothetical protein